MFPFNDYKKITVTNNSTSYTAYTPPANTNFMVAAIVDTSTNASAFELRLSPAPGYIDRTSGSSGQIVLGVNPTSGSVNKDATYRFRLGVPGMTVDHFRASGGSPTVNYTLYIFEFPANP